MLKPTDAICLRQREKGRVRETDSEREKERVRETEKSHVDGPEDMDLH